MIAKSLISKHLGVQKQEAQLSPSNEV